MAFFLPAQPSFGNRLAGVLGQAGADIGSSLIQRSQQRQAKSELDKALSPQQQEGQQAGQPGMQQQGTEPINWKKALDIYGLASKAYGKDAADSYLKSYVDQHHQAAVQQQKAEQMNIQQQQRLELAEKQSALRQQEAAVKEQAAEKKEEAKYQKEVKSYEGMAKRLEQLKPDVGFTFGQFSGFNQIFNRKQIQNRAEAEKLGFLYADKAYTHLNKGVISNAKLQFIREGLAPGPDMSEREYQARIDAIRGLVGLPRNASEEQVDEVLRKSGVSPSSKVNPEDQQLFKELSEFHR